MCGNFVEEIILPDSLQVIGSCAFYNCRRLRRLSVGAGDLTVGSDVFLNCFALADLLVRAAPEEKTGLFALVNNITEAVRALFWLPGAAPPGRQALPRSRGRSGHAVRSGCGQRPAQGCRCRPG